MIEIPLRNRKGEIVARALVDDEDAGQARHRWCLTAGYPSRRLSRRVGGRMLYLHREVMGCIPGDGLQVDHKDRNKLDCRRSNLRAITHAQNTQNVGSRPGSSSRYRGVCWVKRRGCWRAEAKVAGQRHYLGYFHDEDDAGEAARRFRAEHMPFAVES